MWIKLFGQKIATLVQCLTTSIMQLAKSIYDWLQYFYKSSYIRYFRKRVKDSLELAWWSVGCSSAILALIIGLFLGIKIMTLEQAEMIGTLLLPWVVISFGGVAIVGIVFAFLDTLIRYICKREPIIDLDINANILILNNRMSVIENDVRQIKTDIAEINDKLRNYLQ